MKRYLAILNDTSGRWMSAGELSRAVVFDTKDDSTAVKAITAFAKDRQRSVSLLVRIIGGLQVMPVSVSRPPSGPESHRSATTDFGKINFQDLSIGKSMLDQLQPFDSEARKKRLKKQAKKRSCNFTVL